jgi:GNAT superfamily N-acetyltransferase
MIDLPELPVGYSPVPAGHLASVVTYLEMTARPPSRPVPPLRRSLTLARLGATDVATYRALFRAVGEEWLWFSRVLLDDAALQAILQDARVEAYAVRDGARAVGLLELDFRTPGSCELAFFGLTADAVGEGVGRWLMEEALTRAWSRPIARVHVHTCTLDQPDAVGFYVRSGFTAYRRAVEVAPDPRLSGHLPRHVGGHAPLIEA